jgi:hypothetical protein
MRRSTILALVAGGLTPACGLNQEGVLPQRDAIAFPSAAVVAPGGKWLLVANANSDLRFNDGTLVAVDLDHAQGDRSAGTWPDCPEVDYIHPRSQPVDEEHRYCCWDRLDRTILNCDERGYIPPASTVRIGSFSAGMVLQQGCRPPAPGTDCTRACAPADVDPTRGRLFIGVRGNSSLTWIDVAIDAAGGMPVFTCKGTQPSTAFDECDPQHQIEATATGAASADPAANAPALPVPDEPYALTIDTERQLLYVGHLKGDVAHATTGGVSLFDVGGLDDGVRRPPPSFVGPFPAVFPSDAAGLFGVTSLSQRLGDTSGEVFVSSHYVPRVGSLFPTTTPTTCAQASTRNEIALVTGGDVFDTTLTGAETRGIQFIPDIQRAFVLQRVPPALVGFDLSTDPITGQRRATPTDVIETCAGPTFLDLHNPGGAGWQLYVTCFETGQMYVVDPYIPRIVTTIDVGRGPSGLVFGPSPADPIAGSSTETTRGYIVGFSENNVRVLDLDPSSLNQNHVIQRIGFPSTVPRQ